MSFDHLAKIILSAGIRYFLLILLFLPLLAGAQFRLHIEGVDRDSASLQENFQFRRSFSDLKQALEYVDKIPSLLHSRGFPTASIDSMAADSLKLSIRLYVGEQFRWRELRTDSIEPALLRAVGWPASLTSLEFPGWESMRRRLLEYLENNGYPFASLTIDSLQLTGNSLSGNLLLEKGPLYKVDSIRNLGPAKIAPDFLHRYLGTMPGSIYKKEQFKDISTRLLELPFLRESRPWDMSLMGTGAILNLYLEPKKSSQINVLVGLLPANQQLAQNKMLVTGEATINLRNSLGNGETIGLNWQQIQPRSPRLDVQFRQPYLFKSPFGADFHFDLFKKDSSFINITLRAGAQYSLSARQSGTVFIQNFTSNLLDFDTLAIKSSRRLPVQADMRAVSLGLEYLVNTTDYRFNPRQGNELNILLSAGTKTIRKNNIIVRLQDQRNPDFNFDSLYDTVKLKTFQLRLRAAGAKFFPLSRLSTIKTALNAGWLQTEQIQRNELFQIGGYKLLRGFDEESIFASGYGVATVEYRYFIGLNSYFFGFSDAGWAENKLVKNRNFFIGAGLGLALETNAGVFNMSWAVGKRDDSPFNLRQSKIHLGYINYF